MRSAYHRLIDQARNTSWLLLLYLVMVLQVKTGVKVAAIILFVFLFRKELKSFDFIKKRFMWFYAGLIVIALVNLLTQVGDVTVNYLVAALAGISFWILCIATGMIGYLFVKKSDTARLHNTFAILFVINALFTIGQLISFMIDGGTINPYTYQGMNQKYFIGTGDLLRGITYDVSTTNALLNAMGVIYFLERRKFHWLLMCMGVLLLTASNFTNLILFLILLLQFVFRSDRNQKSVIVVCLMLFIVFFARVSPHNKNYLKYVWQKVTDTKIDTLFPQASPPLLSELEDSVLSEDQRKRKIAMLFLDSTQVVTMARKTNPSQPKPILTSIAASPAVVRTKPTIPKPNIHTEPYQLNRDTSVFRRQLIDFAVAQIPSFDTSQRNMQKNRYPGKIMAVQQTLTYLKAHPSKLLMGTGIAKFSSKIAFRATALQFAGGYPAKYAYINPAFRDNHLDLYLNYFTKDQQFHSLMNSPDSVYDQLLAEYGLAGFALFLVFFVGYYAKHLTRRDFALPLLLLIIGAFAIGYWFEQLSIVIVFEMLMFLSMKEGGSKEII
ncbi:MAG: hypothetical protein H7Y42_16120 [Chitinophagaceae bacterium]|nr:hypothetical protein [Chitinophagaceae bacterium]